MCKPSSLVSLSLYHYDVLWKYFPQTCKVGPNITNEGRMHTNQTVEVRKEV